MNLYTFGVYRKGKRLFQIGVHVWCTHEQAAIIVAALDKAKAALMPGDYFASEYEGM